MPEPHKRANRHPKYTTTYRVKNWREYEQALRDRGDITLWLSQEAIGAWTAPKTGKRGGQQVYKDVRRPLAVEAGGGPGAGGFAGLRVAQSGAGTESA